MKRRSNRDYFGPMTGFKGFLHRTAMFLLYPLRKPLIFFPLLILLYLIPTFIGARPSEVHVWYWNKIKSAYNSAAGVVSDKVNPWFADKEEAVPELGGKALPERGIDQLVGMRQKAVRRQMFEKAKSAPQAVDILENEEVVPVSEIKRDEQPQPAADVVQEYNDKISELSSRNTASAGSATITVSQKLPLVYLKDPVPVSGKALVQNANEIIVDGTYIFLYGIYVDPNLPKGIEAKKYLEQFVKDKVVRCDIVAYTYQDIATALCYVDDDSINQRLVDEEFSRNVAL
ncbi:MAG: hypothetical protein ACLUH4_04030 [Alphaproteobacteria bacterium]|uniref:hypothetical protein n=1 Tax=Candidatus Scatocola faecigallinarum TaxID=2840916 RepID=UPI00033AF53C|nr:unknown [Azospirillum sp. CAG:239]